MPYEMILGLLCLACVILGIVIGLSLSRWTVRSRDRMDAPVPPDLGYDPENPINRAHVSDIRVGERDPKTGLIRLH